MQEHKQLKRNILDAAKIAVDELIKVLKEPIVSGGSVSGEGMTIVQADPLGAEKMKTAAQAKRVAFEDALAILERMQEEENTMGDEGELDENIKDTTNFADRYAKK